MIATDFKYDGEYLRNHGFVICNTSQSSGFETINTNPQFTFNNVSLMNGKLLELTTTKYDNRIEIAFSICKDTDDLGVLIPISTYESREMKRWLSRPTFKKFKLLQPDWANFYMEGSFNVTEDIGFDGKIYALNLTFVSNSPLALHEPITHRIKTSKPNERYILFDESDEIGHIYPDIKITCLQSGDLEIHNSNEDRTTIIWNCVSGEEITFSKELLMSSSLPSHEIQNDFNYIFFRISNSYKNRKNILSFSLPVKVEITYSPYVKAVS